MPVADPGKKALAFKLAYLDAFDAMAAFIRNQTVGIRFQLDEALLARHYDLHLLLSPEGIGWTADGQRCQPDLADRRAFFQASRDWLEQHQQPYKVIGGDWQARHDQAFAAVAHLLGQ